MKNTYADTVKSTMRKGDHRGNRITLRDLERGTSFSYEHLRKVVAGEPVVSEECNIAICKFLGLDADAMWHLAKSEKLRKRHPEFAPSILAPADTTLRELWSELTKDQRNQLLDIAKGMAQQNRVTRQLAPA
jgi:hypothetical protein